MTVNMHTVNFVLLFGDAVLNCLVNVFMNFLESSFRVIAKTNVNFFNLHVPANTLVWDVFLCVMDRCLCNCSVDNSCLRLNLVSMLYLLSDFAAQWFI